MSGWQIAHVDWLVNVEDFVRRCGNLKVQVSLDEWERYEKIGAMLSVANQITGGVRGILVVGRLEALTVWVTDYGGGVTVPSTISFMICI